MSVAVLLLSVVSATQEPIKLEEFRSVQVPPAMAVTHATQTPNGLYLLDRRSPNILRIQPDSIHTITHPDIAGAVAVVADSHDSFDLILSQPAVVLRMTPTGGVISKTPIVGVGAGAVVAAAYDGHAWTFVVQNENRLGDVYCTSSITDGRYRQVEFPFPPGPRLAATISAGKLFVIQERMPFSAYVIEPTACTVTEFASLDSAIQDASQADDVERSWFTVAVAGVGEEIWVTLADTRSDSRLIVVVGPDGSVRRKQAVDVPFAIVAAQGKEVVALRSVPQQEVVFYRVVYSTPFHDAR